MKVCFVFNVLVLVFGEDVGLYGGVGAARGDDVIADVYWLVACESLYACVAERDGLYSSCSVCIVGDIKTPLIRARTR
jgi:hypothetical protein